MKNFATLLILCSICFAAQGQFTYKIKADSVKITNDSCTAELILENHTKNINGFLYNRGNGRTEFRSVKVNDSIYVFGGDTLNLNKSVPISSLLAAIRNNAIDNKNYTQEWKWDSLSGTGTGLRLSSISNGPTSLNQQQKLLEVSLAGNTTSGSFANGYSYAGYFSNTRTISTSILNQNVGVYTKASGGRQNVGLIAEATVGNIPGVALIARTTGPTSGSSAIWAISDGGATVQISNYGDSSVFRTALTASANGSGLTNYAAVFSALGGTNNYGLLVSNGYSGFKVDNPTALVHIGASNSTRASLRLDSGSAPITPNNGDVWHANNHLYARLSGTTVQLDDQLSNQIFSHQNGTLYTPSFNGRGGSFENSIVLGDSAAVNSINSTSVMLGYYAGYGATSLNNGYFIGQAAGYGSSNAAQSIFIGTTAGHSTNHAGNSIFLGNYAGNEFGASIKTNNTGQDYSILIGPKTRTGGYKNSILLGGCISCVPEFGEYITNTKDNQFMLAPNITDVRWRNIDYTLPPAQAAASGYVLSNDGSGALSWANPNSLTSSWKLTGNTGTNPITNFIGTVDNSAFVFKTNNVERMRIRPTGTGMDGFVGIGTANPTKLLHLYGLNPGILLEGDSNSYFPGILLKSPVYPHLGVMDPYGIYASNTGGIRIWTATPYGSGEVGATPLGVRTVSTDSTTVTHQVIGSLHQTAALFDVAENISGIAGYSVPGSLFTVKSTGKLNLARYHNNGGEDSVLTTDASGNVKLKIFSAAASGGWSLTGNAGTNPSSNFLGTTDAQRLVFRTKNIERATIDTIGHVGIGTSSNALHTLQVGMLEGTVDGRATARFFSDDAWQTNVRIDNTTSNTSYSLVAGGSGNTSATEGVVRGSFGLVRTKVDGSNTNIPLIIDSTGRVKITTGLGGTNSLPKAALDVDYTTTGILIPRLTTTQRNAITGGDLRTSLLLYNTNVNAFQFYDGSAWRSLSDNGSTPSNAWGLSGNAGTTPASNFLGTTDAQRLVFRTKNIERATIDTFGRVGIGTNAPTDLLTVLKSETGVTADSKIINANAQGATFNTTSSVLTSYGGYFNSNATRASGSNNLTNIGLFATASGAQVNYALKTDGSVNMTNLSTTTDTTSYKPLGVNSSGDVAKVTGWPPAVNYSVQSLTDGSTITWNAANGINAVVTLGGTGRTLSITNPMAGMTYTIRIIQDGTGSRTITTWPTNSKWPSGTTPTLSTVANRYDIVVLYYDGTNYYGTYQQNFQ